MSRTGRSTPAQIKGSQRMARCCLQAAVVAKAKCPNHGLDIGHETFNGKEWIPNG